MTATGVILSHDVEEEWLDCKVEGLVLQKELCHEAQALAVDLVLLPIHLKHRRLAVAVDLSTWWMAPGTQRLNDRERTITLGSLVG